MPKAVASGILAAEDEFNRGDQGVLRGGPAAMTAEEKRLEEARKQTAHWRRWGPYMSDRQWGTVREDYSPDGTAWDYFTHDQARSRAYRWGEDGIFGISDNHQRLCFALALWNGSDPILKERFFGLSGIANAASKGCSVASATRTRIPDRADNAARPATTIAPGMSCATLTRWTIRARPFDRSRGARQLLSVTPEMAFGGSARSVSRKKCETSSRRRRAPAPLSLFSGGIGRPLRNLQDLRRLHATKFPHAPHAALPAFDVALDIGDLEQPFLPCHRFENRVLIKDQHNVAGRDQGEFNEGLFDRRKNVAKPRQHLPDPLERDPGVKQLLRRLVGDQVLEGIPRVPALRALGRRDEAGLTPILHLSSGQPDDLPDFAALKVPFFDAHGLGPNETPPS